MTPRNSSFLGNLGLGQTSFKVDFVDTVEVSNREKKQNFSLIQKLADRWHHKCHGGVLGVK